MRRGERRARGFTYIGLLALIVLIGILLAGAGEVTRVAVQRDHEADLLWIGREYRDAIARYFGHFHRYPPTLAALLGPTAAAGDNAAAATSSVAGMPDFRAMRRQYRDPMTNSPDWTTVPAPGGGIMGVASQSTKAPLKHAGFEKGEDYFETAATYADWQFVYVGPLYGRRPTPLTGRPN